MIPFEELTYPHRRSAVSAHFPHGDEPEAGDEEASEHGVPEILEVVAILKEAGIPCCAVCNCALIYYGAKRIRFVGDYPFFFFFANFVVS